MNWDIPCKAIVTFSMNNGINLYLISAPCLGSWLWEKVLTMKTAIDDAAREEIRTIMIARFMGPIWGPSGADRTQVGPMLAPWTLLSGNTQFIRLHRIYICITQRIVNTQQTMLSATKFVQWNVHICHTMRMALFKINRKYRILAAYGKHVTWALKRLESATILFTNY